VLDVQLRAKTEALCKICSSSKEAPIRHLDGGCPHSTDWSKVKKEFLTSNKAPELPDSGIQQTKVVKEHLKKVSALSNETQIYSI
jgi:hypothetical protein